MNKIITYPTDKKILKYIKSYNILEISNNSTDIKANVGMSIICSKNNSFEISINNKIYEIKENEIYLLNSHEETIYITSKEKCELTYISFEACGAAFFFSSKLIDLYDNLVEISDETTLFEAFNNKEDLTNKLDIYFKDSFKALKMPFNILNIINLLKDNNGVYDIDEINTLSNVPRKIFDKIFRLNVGMSLKALSKIMKSQNN